MTTLVTASLQVNPKKCHFCCEQIKYLGFLLDEDGLRIDPERCEPVTKYPAPINLKTLRRFLGMVNRYSRFIPRDSELKIPLVKLLRKDQPRAWDEELQEAFDKLKKADGCSGSRPTRLFQALYHTK